MRIAFVMIALLAGCVNAKMGEREEAFLKQDSSEMAKAENWHVFNGNMELGEINRPVPGYSIWGYFNPKELIKDPKQNYFPITKLEKNGNKYLKIPGYVGLPEYNLNCGGLFLKKNGVIELSFKAKIAKAEDGKYHKSRTVIMDFRCRDMNKQYGTVKERYPVLIGKTFRPEKEWKKYSFKISVKADFLYKIMFRHFGKIPEDSLNGLCIDDLSLKYIDNKISESEVNEVALTTEKLVPAYKRGETVKLKINAMLKGQDDIKTISLYVRKDYFLTICQAIDVQLKRVPEYKPKNGRSLYSGGCQLNTDVYGSFNTVVTYDGKPVFSKGGNFASLHDIPQKASPLQRKIGGHHRAHGGRYQMLHSNDWPSILTHGLGLDMETKVYALSGLRHAMYAFDLKKVQPKEKTMELSLADAELKLFEKYNIEPVGCLGAWWIYADRKSKRGNTMICSMPDWFYKDEFTRETGVKKDARTVKDEYWSFHVNEIVNRFGKRIDKWMVLVEPQWVLPAKEYVSLQKTAYEIVKKDNPNSLFIAGDATSDQGYNLTNWVESLHKLGFEKYLDCASFNPYGSSSDYIDGVLFRYSNLIERLREILVPETKLWEEELYYIANTKRKQDKAAQALFSAGDAQRHYLLGLLNNLRGVTAITTSSLFKSARTPSDVCAGLNALSSFLSGKSETEHIKMKNKLLRCGIFSDKEKQNCVGVIWALKAKGAGVTPATRSLKAYDCFGNALEFRGELLLGLDPVFLSGDYSDLKKFFLESKFSMGQAVELRSRTFKGKTFLEAQNKSGGKNIVTVKFEGGKPSVRLIFKGSDYKRFSVDGKLENKKYTSSLQGVDSSEIAKIIPISSVKEFIVPESATKPLTLKIQDAATLDIWTEQGKLWIKANVIDAQITPAKGDNLYTADALEVFIDRTPFNRLDIDVHNRKMTKGLSLIQYAFAPEISKSGKQVIALDCGTGKKANSKASVKMDKTKTGYVLTASIPLSEIFPASNADGVIGMNFELCRRDGEKKFPKAVFVKPEKPSYKYRLHYSLFEIPAFEGNILKNGGCEKGTSTWSSSMDRRLKRQTFSSSEDAYSGNKSIKISILEEPKWGPTIRRGAISCNNLSLKAGKYILTFYAKGNKLDHMKVRLGRKTKQNIMRSGDLPLANSWTKYEMSFNISADTEKGCIYMEFFSQRRDQNSYALIDEVSLKKSN